MIQLRKQLLQAVNKEAYEEAARLRDRIRQLEESLRTGRAGGGATPPSLAEPGRRRGVKCQFCSNPATVHLTDIVNKQKKELHLCQSCAEKQQLLKQQELNLPAILQTLIGQHVGPADR